MVRPELPTRSIDEAVAALGKAPFEAWCAVEMPSVATTSMRLSVQTRGDAHELFWNDPVQILRGCLLVSRFGCAIEPETLQMMTSHKVRLAHEPAERVGKAVEDLLYGSFVHDALTETVDVLVAALPEVAACRNFDQHTPYHIGRLCYTTSENQLLALWKANGRISKAMRDSASRSHAMSWNGFVWNRRLPSKSYCS